MGCTWTWTALDADSKLCLSYRIGGRDGAIAFEFMQDLAYRLANRVQLTTDRNRVYLNAVEDAFGSEIDYAMLVKIYGHDAGDDSRYSPAECIVQADSDYRATRSEAHFRPATLNART